MYAHLLREREMRGEREREKGEKGRREKEGKRKGGREEHEDEEDE